MTGLPLIDLRKSAGDLAAPVLAGAVMSAMIASALATPDSPPHLFAAVQGRLCAAAFEWSLLLCVTCVPVLD